MTSTYPDKNAITALNNADWAWEFLRRNPDYQRDYRLSRACLLKITKHTSKASFIRIHRQCPYAKKWGLIYMCNPNLSPKMALVAWNCEAISWGIVAETRATKRRDDKIDLDIKTARFIRAFIVITSKKQSLFMRIGLRPACLEITGDSILLNAVHMRFFVDGVDQIQGAIFVLEAARAITKNNVKLTGKPVPHVTQLRRLKYLIAAEKAVDGALLREIGAALYGKKRAEEEWGNLDSRSFKDQISRAKRQGVSLMQGGYRKFLH